MLRRSARDTAVVFLAAQDPGLLDRELLVGQHTLLVQGAELAQLGDRVHGRRGRGGRGRRRRGLGVGRLVVAALLLGPAVGLAPGDPVADRRGGFRGGGGGGGPPRHAPRGGGPL